jgi:adenine-specific DNA-methyltransferase
MLPASPITFDDPHKDYAPTVLIGDCQTIMPTLDRQFDLIVTSPPYDAAKAYEGPRDLAAYTEFAAQWLREIPRLLTPTGSFWLNIGYTKAGENETMPLSYLYFAARPAELRLIQEIVWHYEGGMSYKRRFAHRTERWMWFSRTPGQVFFDLDAVRDLSLNRTIDPRNHPAGKNPTDYWYFDRVVGGRGRTAEKTDHPCQFPEAMIERIIKACSPSDSHVLDPFAGSGTVGRVARRFGRHATLIERNAGYLAI